MTDETATPTTSTTSPSEVNLMKDEVTGEMVSKR